MTIKPVYIEQKKEGYAHTKCYLSSKKGCSDKISGEHVYSHNFLEILERNKATIDVYGFPWIPKEQVKPVGKNSFKSNILCTNHNSKLSPLDTEIGKFASAICEIDKDFMEDESNGSKNYQIDGTYIERWLAKTIVGMTESKQMVNDFGSSFSYKSHLLDLICFPQARWPLGWGLYFSSNIKIHSSSSFGLIPMFLNQNVKELIGVKLKFIGFEMHFLMSKPGNPNPYGLHRPRKMLFKKGSITSEIIFEWRDRKAGRDIEYYYEGKYSGPSPELPFTKT